MATSQYFNNYQLQGKSNEQRLYEDLLVESIKINGHDVYYMPREDWDDTDQLFGENIQSKFKRAIKMEMYLANIEGYEGDGDFFSKFGLEIRENTNLVVAKRTFDKYKPKQVLIRPREGDLIFVPVMNKIFEIKFVEEELLFFARGAKIPYVYELRCEMFRYGNEQINTGVETIDNFADDATYTIQITVRNGSGNYQLTETVYQGTQTNPTASGTVSNWLPTEKKLYITNITGTFSTTANVIGLSSNTQYSLTGVDTMGDHVYYDMFDNNLIQLEANSFIDLSETNPFGTP